MDNDTIVQRLMKIYRCSENEARHIVRQAECSGELEDLIEFLDIKVDIFEGCDYIGKQSD